MVLIYIKLFTGDLQQYRDACFDIFRMELQSIGENKNSTLTVCQALQACSLAFSIYQKCILTRDLSKCFTNPIQEEIRLVYNLGNRR